VTNDTTDTRTALEALCDLIEQDDAEFGPEAASDGSYRVRMTVTTELGLDCLTVLGGAIFAALRDGEPCGYTLTEADALAVLVAGGHREGGAA